VGAGATTELEVTGITTKMLSGRGSRGEAMKHMNAMRRNGSFAPRLAHAEGSLVEMRDGMLAGSSALKFT
jgi:hypothetical protein